LWWSGSLNASVDERMTALIKTDMVRVQKKHHAALPLSSSLR
jgi:hypothetical protein